MAERVHFEIYVQYGLRWTARELLSQYSARLRLMDQLSLETRNIFLPNNGSWDLLGLHLIGR
jgi:hypothetical protein